jgi:hypothetical protein
MKTTSSFWMACNHQIEEPKTIEEALQSTNSKE